MVFLVQVKSEAIQVRPTKEYQVFPSFKILMFIIWQTCRSKHLLALNFKKERNKKMWL